MKRLCRSPGYLCPHLSGFPKRMTAIRQNLGILCQVLQRGHSTEPYFGYHMFRSIHFKEQVSPMRGMFAELRETMSIVN
jgi:hypothetical protein